MYAEAKHVFKLTADESSAAAMSDILPLWHPYRQKSNNYQLGKAIKLVA